MRRQSRQGDFPGKKGCCRCRRRSIDYVCKTRSPAPRSSRPTLQSRVRQRATVRNAEAIWGQVGRQGAPAVIGPAVFGIESRFSRQAGEDAAVLRRPVRPVPPPCFPRPGLRRVEPGPAVRRPLDRLRSVHSPLRRALCSTPPPTRTTRPPRPDAAGRSPRQDGTGFTKPDRNSRVRYGGAKTGGSRGDADPAPTPSDTGISPSTTSQPASSRCMKIAIPTAEQGIDLRDVGRRPCRDGASAVHSSCSLAGDARVTARLPRPPAKSHISRPGRPSAMWLESMGQGRRWGLLRSRPPRPRQGRRRRLGAPRGRQAVGRRGKGWPKWFLRKTRVACYRGLYGRNRPAPNEAGRRYGRIRPPPRAELRSVSRLRPVAGPPGATSRLPRPSRSPLVSAAFDGRLEQQRQEGVEPQERLPIPLTEQGVEQAFGLFLEDGQFVRRGRNRAEGPSGSSPGPWPGDPAGRSPAHAPPPSSRET